MPHAPWSNVGAAGDWVLDALLNNPRKLASAASPYLALRRIPLLPHFGQGARRRLRRLPPALVVFQQQTSKPHHQSGGSRQGFSVTEVYRVLLAGKQQHPQVRVRSRRLAAAVRHGRVRAYT